MEMWLVEVKAVNQAVPSAFKRVGFIKSGILTCIGNLLKFSENLDKLLLMVSDNCKSSLGLPAL
jgi:hypothetical protein